MTRSYAHILQFLCNRTLAVTDAHAALVLSALRGELNIDTIITAEGIVLGEPEMHALVREGRSSADNRRPRQQERERIYAMAGNVAIIPIRGTLVKTWGIEPYSGRTGYDGVKAKLYAALEDDDVDGIWLDIESPGGVVAGMFDLSDAIFASNERSGGKPIWAIADETCASAAYCLGSAADRLYTPRTGMVGSVGICAIYINESGALEKEGLDARIFRGTKTPLKMGLNSIEQPSDEVVDRFQAMIDADTELLFDTVARNMRMSKRAVAEAQGDVYRGEEARAKGFVSGVQSWDQAWTRFMRHLDRR